MYHVFPCWQKKKMADPRNKKYKKRVTAPILKPTDDHWETGDCLFGQNVNFIYCRDAELQSSAFTWVRVYVSTLTGQTVIVQNVNVFDNTFTIIYFTEKTGV